MNSSKNSKEVMSMGDQLPAIIVLAPMFGAMFVGLFGNRDHRVCFPIVFASLLISLCASIAAAQQVFTSGEVIDYFMAGWEEPIGIGIHLRIDSLNALILVLISVVVVLVSFFSIRRAGDQHTEKTPQFYILYLLLCVGLLGISITGDAFNLFVLVEVSSLTSYGLVAMGSSRRGTHAALNYLLMGTVGASFYLLGVGYLYLKTGTLNMQDIHAILQANGEIAESNAVSIAFLLILVGIWIKMAFFPLHGWLPNAYSYCPSTSACLLAPLMTKVSVYVMVRVMIGVFGVEWVFVNLGWSHLVVWLAVIAILAGSMLALAQREIKKMLCYLIVAEVGYMVGGAWLSDPDHWGLTGSLYHILADAMMTLCLFLAAGVFAKRLGAIEIKDLEGLFKKMPLTSVAFVIAALGMIGVPPTAGFYSKFYLIRGAIEGGHWEYVAALLISSLVNAVLFFRIFEIAFFGNKPAEGHGHDDHHEEETPNLEAPWSALFPLLASAAIIILLGLFNGPIVDLLRESLEHLPSIVTTQAD
ncbi:MAG: monovalent cation/H+ antiporter subunit D family protein [Verrucomicrobiales bacterium]|nr:monovalent cation/H+ antiporter subunit D family protein [Verrucomicrobiales bacterium]